MDLKVREIRPLLVQFPGKSETLTDIGRMRPNGADNVAVDGDTIAKIVYELDDSVGLHWPFLATRIWKPISQPLATAYFSTSRDFLGALGPLFAMDNFFMPVFVSKFQRHPEGLIANISLNFEADARVSEVFDIFINLAFHSICTEIPGVELSSIRINFGFQRRPMFDVFESILQCRVTYGNANPHTIYPNAFLEQKIGTYRPDLNKVLLAEIEKQCSVSADSQLIEKIRRKMRSESNFGMSIDAFAKSIGVPSRTLQRELKENGTSFKELGDTVFREKVLILIESGARNSDIVTALQLRNTASLSARVKRLFDKSLRELRVEKAN